MHLCMHTSTAMYICECLYQNLFSFLSEQGWNFIKSLWLHNRIKDCKFENEWISEGDREIVCGLGIITTTVWRTQEWELNSTSSVTVSRSDPWHSRLQLLTSASFLFYMEYDLLCLCLYKSLHIRRIMVSLPFSPILFKYITVSLCEWSCMFILQIILRINHKLLSHVICLKMDHFFKFWFLRNHYFLKLLHHSRLSIL